ncbi:fluoride efflux transporter CrcB [uncultured Jatrophihabitans sp.]|uniref:fluoride efflux transporter CrcB n=1 Tax=uncultured Jatrophihabitans sp. TaxID=1610747 RepID=UPI0035CB6A7E
MIAVWISLAGGLGAVARLVVDGAIRERWSATFPIATFAINVSGSLLLGVLTGLVLFRHSPTDLAHIAGTGFCGGYTTFSTASFETVRLVQRGATSWAVLYGVGSVLTTVGAAGLGLALAS